MNLFNSVTFRSTKIYIVAMTLLTVIMSNIVSTLVTIGVFFHNGSMIMLVSMLVNIVVSLTLIYCLFRFSPKPWLIWTTIGYYYCMSIGMWASLSFVHHMTMMYYVNIVLYTILLLDGSLRYIIVALQSVLSFLLLLIDFTWRQDVISAVVLDLPAVIGVYIVCFNMMIILFIHVRAYNHSFSVVENSAAMDPLTKVGNRLALISRLEALIETPDKLFSIVYVDINDFKKINDTLGHSAGDKVLKEFARLIKKYIRNQDAIYRNGGDEFIIIFEGMTSDDARTRMNSICSALKFEQVDDYVIQFAYGIASIDQEDNLNADLLMSLADNEMYKAKSMHNRTLSEINGPIIEGVGQIGSGTKMNNKLSITSTQEDL